MRYKALLVLFAFLPIPGMSQDVLVKKELSYSLPFKKGAVMIDSTGLQIFDVALDSKFGSIRIIARKPSINMTLTLWVEPAKTQGNSLTVRDTWWPKQEKSNKSLGLPPSEIKQYESEDVAIVTYVTALEKPRPVRNREIRAYAAAGDLWSELHVSSDSPQVEGTDVLTDYVRSFRVMPDYVPKSMDYLKYGAYLYSNHEYKQAAVVLQQALDFEKQNRTLSQLLWRVLLDNLGISYGITKDYTHAKEVFDYGVSQDPEYPLFYYNLACAAGAHALNRVALAEQNDMPQAISYLKTAFAHKGNVNQGEKMPDPMTDDSFKRFRKNAQFADAVQAMKSNP